MTYFLVDYENTGNAGFPGKDIIAGQDVVIVFYTEHAHKIDMNVLTGLESVLRFIKVPCGNQSLDMCMSSYIGYLIGKHGKTVKFMICSNDSDYDGILKYWRDKGFDISRKTHASGPENEKKAVSNKKKKTDKTQADQAQNRTKSKGERRAELNARLQKKLSELKLGKDIINRTASIILQNIDDGGKIAAYRAIVKTYGQQRGLKYYNFVKQIMSDYLTDS